MQIENLFQPFEVKFMDTDECPMGLHSHTFFELVIIISGKGIHHVNQNKFDYQGENIFLVMPGHSHHFDVKEKTSFAIIRFNNIYLDGQKVSNQHGDLGEWIHKLEYVLQNGSAQGCIVRNVHDKPLVRAIVIALKEEYKNKQALHKEVVQQLINTLLTIVGRNISLHFAERLQTDPNIPLDIIHYIHQNIYHAEKLKAESIASHFNISQNYISEYFKKHTNENLQQFIINYKLSLVEIRLKHSDMRMNEIAYELGFTDESHLTKTFKKHKGISPAAFRKDTLALAS